MSQLVSALRPSLVMLLGFTALTGIAYPLVVTGVGQALFPHQANGSLVRDGGGRVVGSAMIGQGFAASAYFHPRASAAGSDGYDASASSGSNLGPTSADLATSVKERVAAARADDGVTGAVPADMATASGSGLDPDISPANALAQVPRVAKARGVDPAALRSMVDRATESAPLIGDSHVNVLLLNRQLDAAAARSAR